MFAYAVFFLKEVLLHAFTVVYRECPCYLALLQERYFVGFL